MAGSAAAALLALLALLLSISSSTTVATTCAGKVFLLPGAESWYVHMANPPSGFAQPSPACLLVKGFRHATRRHVLAWMWADGGQVPCSLSLQAESCPCCPP